MKHDCRNMCPSHPGVILIRPATASLEGPAAQRERKDESDGGAREENDGFVFGRPPYGKTWLSKPKRRR